jgi:hypothetical protein
MYITGHYPSSEMSSSNAAQYCQAISQGYVYHINWVILVFCKTGAIMYTYCKPPGISFGTGLSIVVKNELLKAKLQKEVLAKICKVHTYCSDSCIWTSVVLSKN